MAVDMKYLIAETLKELIRRGSVDKITVKALIEECHISRQTFYYHFKDIMDVMEWSIKRGTNRLVEESLKMKDMRSALKVFISFTVEQSLVLKKLLDSQRRPQIEKYLLDSMETYLNELDKHQIIEVPVNQTDRSVLLKYNACGLVGTLLIFGRNPNIDQDKLASQLERILLGQLELWNK